MPNDLWTGWTMGSTAGLAVLAYAGACVGSFIHVLALRWAASLLNPSATGHWRKALWGRSQCASCHRVLKPWQLIPLLGFVVVRGHCAFCHAQIGWRDWLAEWVLALAWLALLASKGLAWPTALWLAWSSVLLLLALIDLDTYLLPDVLTLGLTGAGILASIVGLLPLSTAESFWGAGLGYGLLASVAWLHRRWRGREGLGLGDAKLLAALGAWLGPWLLPVVLWMAALIGLVWGLVWRWRGQAREDGAFPFGPALALAGLLGAVLPPGLAWLGVLG